MNTNTENMGYRQENAAATVILPTKYNECSMEHFLRLIARMLSSLIYMNDYKLRAHEFMRQQQQNAAINDASFDAESNKGNQAFQRNFQSSPHAATPGSTSGESFFSAGTPMSAFATNLPLSSHGIVLTRFHSKTPPKISVLDYLYRLTKFSNLDHTVLLATLSYIDLLMIACPAFEISSLTVHRFLLAATTVACKGLRDSFYTNEHYAKVGGVHVSELNILEQELLTQMNYRILPRELTSELLRLEIESKKFVVFPSDGNNSKLFLPNGYDVLTKIYHNMINLVGRWETVIYVSDRLPVFFPVKEQQSLLKYQRSMWAKDVNFIENAKHKLSFMLESSESFVIDNPEPKRYSELAEHVQLSSAHAEKRKANRNIKLIDDKNAYLESPEKRRKIPNPSIPADLLANYFNPEIFKQTQINNPDDNTSETPISRSNKTDNSELQNHSEKR